MPQRDSFQIEFDTEEFPGKILFVEVTLRRRVTGDKKKVFHLGLKDHPLYPVLVRYVQGNPPNVKP